MRRNLPYLAALAIYFLVKTIHAESENDLVEIGAVDSTIQIDLKYASSDNLTGRVLYPVGFKAKLRRGVALELKAAQEALRPLGVGLKVWDAYRPLAVQKALFDVINNPSYVAVPGGLAMHNRGVAVDVTLVDTSGRDLPMPTAFDVMGHAASYFYEGGNPVVLKNLTLLQRVMKQAGFYACRTEWWHFFSRKWEQYPNVLEAPEKDLRMKKKTAVFDRNDVSNSSHE